jgi:hypothetical protein
MKSFLPGCRASSFALATFVALAFWSGSAAAQGTQQQRAACEADAQRLCGEFIPDVDRITSCMIAKQRFVSAGCRREMERGKKARSPG